MLTIGDSIEEHVKEYKRFVEKDIASNLPDDLTWGNAYITKIKNEQFIFQEALREIEALQGRD